MGRFMYVHFGDDVPRNIEKEYNKLLRKTSTDILLVRSG